MAVLRQGNPNRICIHHAAVNGVPVDIPALQKRLAGYEVTHSKKDWAEEIKTPGEHGYHYIEYHIAVAGNGHELRLQDDKYVLYHAGDNARGAESFNLHGIAILIDGNYMVDQPNDQQKEAVSRIIARFEKQYKVDVIVRGHKETSLTGTSCPGTNIGVHDSGWMKSVIARANEIIAKGLPTNPLQEDAPVVVTDPQVVELRARIDELTKELTAERAALASSIGNLQAQKQLTADIQKKYDDLYLLKNKLENEKLDAVNQLNTYKKSRFLWLVTLLERLFPEKKTTTP